MNNTEKNNDRNDPATPLMGPDIPPSSSLCQIALEWAYEHRNPILLSATLLATGLSIYLNDQTNNCIKEHTNSTSTGGEDTGNNTALGFPSMPIPRHHGHGSTVPQDCNGYSTGFGAAALAATLCATAFMANAVSTCCSKNSTSHKNDKNDCVV